jgi:uncharacterized protein
VEGDYDVPPAFGSSVVAPRTPRPADAPDAVLRSLDRTWTAVFEAAGDSYSAPQLVIVGERGAPPSCGPLSGDGKYCPRARTIDLDVRRAGEQWPYVLAHEVGHHVQELRGTFAETQREKAEHRGFRTDIRLREELQAECYAGVWAYAVGLPPPDQFASPPSADHGTGQQRESWFARGRNTGRPAECDTFAAREL